MPFPLTSSVEVGGTTAPTLWRAFQNGGWPMKSTAYRPRSAVEVAETEDENGLSHTYSRGPSELAPGLKRSPTGRVFPRVRSQLVHDGRRQVLGYF
jgi:hypothetical protein